MLNESHDSSALICIMSLQVFTRDKVNEAVYTDDAWIHDYSHQLVFVCVRVYTLGWLGKHYSFNETTTTGDGQFEQVD